ncbi:MAG: HAMP domain-containing sensor histidine kinase [Chloroflexota bacterium]|nr:HAMP domain-containing sensor histidine kinase [Chloroflexota bacterium]
MHTLRERLILSHILPLLLVLPLVFITLVYILETQILLTDLSQDITEQANLIAKAISHKPVILEDVEQAEAFIGSIDLHLDGRILLIDSEGLLLAASLSPATGENGSPIDLEALETVLAGQPVVMVYHGLLEQRAQALVPVADINENLIGIVSVTESLEGAASRFARLRWWILGILLLQLLLAGLIGYILSVRLARPIQHASEAVVDIANGKQVDPLPEEGPEEIRQLAAAVNTLSERLRLLEATRRRSLANIVHELGRPLGAMRAAVHVLRQGAGDDPQIREEFLAGVEGQIERMEPLLDDLTQLHSQVVGNTRLELRPVSLSQWLPPELLPWRAAAIDKDLDWHSSIPSGLPAIALDPDRMAQVMGNLLSNAIKYTPAGGSVTVDAGVGDQEVWIRISDTGPGINPDEQQRVFEPFYRSENDRRFPQGLGLGLTIAQELVEAHSGYLELISDRERGSQFIVHLPLQIKNRCMPD